MKQNCTDSLIKLIIILLCLVQFSWAFSNFTNTAFNLKEGQYQVGIFSPLDYGYSDSLQLSTHPLLFFVMPNFDVKWLHSGFEGWQWASEHRFFAPTYLLRVLTREGTGGIISPEFDIPQMVAFYNGLVFSKQLHSGQIISLKTGFQLAVKSSKLDNRTTIDLPFVYPRMKVFYSGYRINAGGNFIGKLTEAWGYDFSLDLFWAEEMALENTGFVNWNSQGKTQIRLGYFLSYAQFPFGEQAHLLFPLLDVVWKFE